MTDQASMHLEMALYLHDEIIDVDAPCKYLCSFYVVMHIMIIIIINSMAPISSGT